MNGEFLLGFSGEAKDVAHETLEHMRGWAFEVYPDDTDEFRKGDTFTGTLIGTRVNEGGFWEAVFARWQMEPAPGPNHEDLVHLELYDEIDRVVLV